MIDGMAAEKMRRLAIGLSLRRLWQSVQSWPLRDTWDTLRQRFREDRLGVTAGSLTFTTTIAIVPLATVMLAVFTAFPVFARFQRSLQDYFIQSLVPDSIAKTVMTSLTQFALKANRLGTVGLLLLALTALMLMLTIDRTLNGIWRVRRPRPMAQRVLVYWAAATLGPLLLGVSLSMTSYALSASRGLVEAMPGTLSVVLGALEFLLLTAAIAALFYYVPNTRVRWSHAFMGAGFVSVGFEIAKRGLAWYLGTVPSYTTVYGAFATVPIFLIWLYLSWVIVLLGAVITAYAPSLQMHVRRRPAAPGLRFEVALALLRELMHARDGAAHGLSIDGLAQRLRTDPLQLDPVLDTLIDLNWIGRLNEEGAARYVLLCNPGMTPAQPLVARFLLEPTPTVQRFWQHAKFADMTLLAVLGE